jgi:predicted RNA-binding protein YlqC (UPF0109 family)
MRLPGQEEPGMSETYTGDVPKLILEVAKALVDHPEQVQVDASQEGDTLVLELTVAESDLGRVIGRSGRTARALRTLLSASAAKAGKRCALEILE